MGILDNIVNGLKGQVSKFQIGKQQQAPNALYGEVDNTQINPEQQILSGISPAINGEVNGTPQSSSAIMNAVNNTSFLEPTRRTQIANTIKNSQLRPSNWSNETRARVGNILNGIAQTPYNENTGFWGALGMGIAKGNQAYNNYTNSKNMLGFYGFDTNLLSPFADYTQLTPDKIVSMGVRQRQNQVRKEIAMAKDETERNKIILKAVNDNLFSPQEGEFQLKANNMNAHLQESNQTKKTDAQVGKIKKETEFVGKPKVNISIRKGGTKSTVEHRHTGGSGGSSKPKLLY